MDNALTQQQQQVIDQAKIRAQERPPERTQGLTPGQQEMLANAQQRAPAPAEPVERMRGRTLASGLTFGHSEEVEAAVRSLLPESLGGGEYDVIRDELRGRLSAYSTKYPYEAITLEIAGAILPTIAAQFIPGAGQAATAANTVRVAGMANNLGKGAKFLGVNGGLGFVGGTGFSEGENADEIIDDGAQGAAWGTAAGAGGQLVARGLGNLATKGVEKFKSRSGSDTAAQAYLNRLRKQTGLNTEQLVDEIRAGNVMADFEHLGGDIKMLVSEGGEASADILERSGQRAAVQQATALDELTDSLAPDSNGNVVRTVRDADKAARQQGSADYEAAYAATPQAPQGLAPEMREVIRRNPESAKEMARNIQTRGDQPLFNVVKGEVIFLRAPTMRDAEELLSGVNTVRNKAVEQGNGRYAHSLGELEGGYRPVVDAASPKLKAARQNWAAIESKKTIFEMGRLKALKMEPEVLAMEVEELNQEQLNALRMGIMAAIKTKLTLKTSPLNELTNDTQKMGIALRLLLPGETAEKLLRKLTTANNARRADQLAQPNAGSMTHIQGARKEAMGSTVSAQDFRSSLTDIGAFMRVIGLFIKNKKPGLTDAQRKTVVKTLYETDPDLVIDALTNAENSAAVSQALDKTIDGLVLGARNVANQQMTQETSR